MKKLLLISALVSSVLLADQKPYEVSAMVGYDFAEGNLNVKNDGYFTGGVEVQFNSPDSKISPELSVFGTPQKVKLKNGNKTRVTRGAFNGVYTFDAVDAFTPFVKAGIGLETFNDTSNADGPFFLDAGAGFKYALNENFSLKAEAIYLAKANRNHAGNFDSNLLTLVGITYAFGDGAQKEAPVKEEVVVAVAAAPVDGDDDKDGVLNSKDQCPTTEMGVKVDEKGCDLDSDKDGVINANDICPNTPLGAEVNSDGCPKTVKLAINFENDSAAIKADSNEKLDSYASFLTTYTNYSAKIVGHTDSRGSAKYNQKLSERRAAAVVEALKARGVDAKQLSSVGMGEEKPVADNSTKEGRAQNRRIEAELTRN